VQAKRQYELFYAEKCTVQMSLRLKEKVKRDKIAHCEISPLMGELFLLPVGDWRSGSAGALQAQGRGFKSLIAHHSKHTNHLID
jgi:hypothetical protein